MPTGLANVIAAAAFIPNSSRSSRTRGIPG
jgi:hypothetical protein